MLLLSSSSGRTCQTPRQRTCWFFLLFLICLFSFMPQTLSAPQGRIKIDSTAISKKDNMLLVDLTFSLEDDDLLLNLLKNGAVIELEVTTQLEVKRSWWSNSSIATQTVTSIIRHDPLSREFDLTIPGAPNEHKRDKNLTRLLINSWHSLHIPLVSIDEIIAAGTNKTFLLETSVSLRHSEIPPWLANNAVFWSADIMPTAHSTYEFSPDTPKP